MADDAPGSRRGQLLAHEHLVRGNAGGKSGASKYVVTHPVQHTPDRARLPGDRRWPWPCPEGTAWWCTPATRASIRPSGSAPRPPD